MSLPIVIAIEAESAAAAAEIGSFLGQVSQGLGQVKSAGEPASKLLGEIGDGFLSLGEKLVDYTRQAIDGADAMGRFAEKTGVTLATLEELRRGGLAEGLKFEEVQQGLGHLDQLLASAARNGADSLAVFHAAGGDLEALAKSGASTDTVLRALNERFRSLADPALKQQLATQLMGGNGEAWSKTLGGNLRDNATDEQRSQVTQLAGDARTFNATLDQLKSDFQDVFTTVAHDLLPILQGLASQFLETERSTGIVSGTAGTLVDTFKALLIGGRFLFELFRSLGIVIGSGLGAAFVILENNLGAVIQLAKLWWDNFHAVQELITSLIARLGILAEAMTDVLAGRWQDAGRNLKAVTLGFGDDFAGTFKRVADNGVQAFDVLKDTAVKNVQDLGSIAKQMGGEIQRGLGGALDFSAAVSGSASNPASLPSPGSAPAGHATGNPDADKQKEATAKLVAEIEKLYAQATQSRRAQLDAEEKAYQDKIAAEIKDTAQAETEKLHLAEVYSRKRAELDRQEATQKRAIALAQLENNRALIENDPFLTKLERAQQLQPIIAAELQLNAERRNAASATLASADTDERRLAAQQELTGLQREQVALVQKLQELQSQGTFFGEFGSAVKGLKEQGENVWHQLADGFTATFNTAVSSISNGISGLIQGTKTWGQALHEIGTSILNTVVQSIVQIGVRWILTRTMMALFGKALLAAELAALAPIAAAQSAIWATPATLATIASYGGAEAAAPGLISLAEGLTLASSLKGMATGGYTGDGSRYQPAGIVHAGEYVFSAPAVDRLGLDTLDALHQGGALTPSMASRVGEVGGSSASGATTVQGHSAHIGIFMPDDHARLKRFFATAEGKRMFVDLARENSLEFGLTT